MELAIVISIIIAGLFFGFAVGTSNKISYCKPEIESGMGVQSISTIYTQKPRWRSFAIIISLFTAIAAIYLVMCIGLEKISFALPTVYAVLAGLGFIGLAIVLGIFFYKVVDEKEDFIMSIDSIVNLIIIAVAINVI